MRKAVRAVVIRNEHVLLMYRNKFGQEYYSLVGGGIRMGEDPVDALKREVFEETSLEVANPILVIVEDAGEIFGTQYIYVCDYAGGEIGLLPESEEAKITAMGQNLYEPVWLPLSDLPSVNLLPKKLQQTLIEHLAHGWEATPIALTISD